MKRGWWILALLALFLATNGYVFPTVAARIASTAGLTSFRPLDLTPNYSPSEAHASLASLGDGGRRMYAMVELTIDVIYPIVYAFLFYLVARWLLARSAPPPPRWMERATLLPFLAAALDLLENVLVLALMMRFPERSDGLARVASLVTTTKLLSLIATLLLLLFLLGRMLVRRRAPASG